MIVGNFRKITTTTLNHHHTVIIKKSICLLRKDYHKLMVSRDIYEHFQNFKKHSLLKISDDFQFAKSSSTSILEPVPSSLRFLFIDESDGNVITTYPTLMGISSLVRKMNSINVDVDSFEDKLNLALKLSSNHDSRNYFLKWGQPPEQYEKNKSNLPIECFKKLIL